MKMQNPDILVRPAKKQDVSEIYELNKQLGYPDSYRDSAQRLDDLLSQSSHTLFVAQTPQGKVVGWVHGYIRRLLFIDAHIEIGGLIVNKAYRSQGIGKKLIHACETWAKNKAINSVYVRSNIIRKDALNFYQHIGYKLLKTSLTFSKKLAP